VFLDADKENYSAYYELAMRLLRPRGIIVIDNTLWSGDVINEQSTDATSQAIRALNAHIRVDSRVCSVVLPVADGVTVVWKK